MKEKKSEILYSDPINDIISNPPGRMIRWGSTIILSVLVLLLMLSWLIKYPDIVTAPVEITTVNPPVSIISKVTGRINNLYVSDREKVKKGQLLAAMETAALVSQVEKLSTAIDTVLHPEQISFTTFPGFTELGELQVHYSAFVKSLSELDTYNKNDFYGSKIISVTDEIAELHDYINKLKIKETLLSENLEIERKKYRRDSVLWVNKVLTDSDFEKSMQSFNLIKLGLAQSGLDRSAKTIELSERKQLLQDYRIRRDEGKENLISELIESFMNLKAQLQIWTNNYLLISPVEGTVTFTRFWKENQSVTKDDQVLNIVPDDSGNLIGRINLSMQRSGKVRIGKSVNIKLSGYPYLEYGIVRGVVKSKSLVPSGNEYIIEVSLPQGLTTLYGKNLEFSQNMQGSAEILTDDLRLLQKVLNPFRYLITKNKS
jgi:multidrug resistance efflux pump